MQLVDTKKICDIRCVPYYAIYFLADGQIFPKNSKDSHQKLFHSIFLKTLIKLGL